MAGLLDSLFDPSTYGGSGGLLARLSQMTTPVTPSAGFPDQGATFADRFNAIPNAPQPVSPSGRSFDAMAFDPNTYVPNQAQPIAVGNYQMPRAGNADLYQPQQVSIPPNAQPTQGQLPQQAPQPEAALPPALGGNQIGGNLGAGFQNFVNAGGPLQALAGGLTGLFTGQRTDPLGMQQQNLKAQYDALVPVVGPQRALLAVLNPEAGKTILTEALTNKNEVKDVQDSFGGHHLEWVNPLKPGVVVREGGLSGGASGGPGNDLQAMTDNLSRMAQGGADRQTMLQQVPSEYRGYVDALLSGRALPTNIGRSPARAAIMTIAHAVDPNFNEETIPTRIAMRKDFSGEGKNGQAIGAFNTVQHHIDQVSDAAEEFYKAGGGSNYPAFNSIKGAIADNTGWDPKLRDAAQKLTDKMNAAEHEVQNAYNAGHITDADRKTWEAIKTSNLPANQLRQRLADFEDLLAGKRDSLNHMYRTQFGEDAPAIDRQANEATMKKVHGRLEAGQSSYSSGGNTATNKPQTVIQNGHTYTLQPDGSYK